MKCTQCGGALQGVGSKKYCVACKTVHVRRQGKEGVYWGATGELYEQQPAKLTLQQPDDANLCFVMEIDTPPQPRQLPALTQPQPLTGRPTRSFRRKPLLHFVWFGPADSIEKFAPAFLWAQCLPASWEGVCVWLDAKTFATLPEHCRFGRLQKVKGYVPTLRDQALRSLGWIDSLERRSVHFICNDTYLEEFARGGEAAQRLVAAIGYERAHDPPWCLAQVASDIMRILVLLRAGGAYFDFDVSPNMMTAQRGFAEATSIDLGDMAMFGHPKGLITENDIVFADPGHEAAADGLEALLTEMAKYFTQPDARARRLHAALDKALGQRVDLLADAYKAARHPQQDLLQGVARLVAVALCSNSKDHYLRSLTDEIKIFVGCVSDGIEAATFQPFQGNVLAPPGDHWKKLELFFSHETRTKVFYSWKDPGVTAAVEWLQRQGQLAMPESKIIGHTARTYTIREPVTMFQSHACGSSQVRYEVLSGDATTTPIVVDRDYVMVKLESCDVRSIATGFPTQTGAFDTFTAFVHHTILGSAVMPPKL